MNKFLMKSRIANILESNYKRTHKFSPVFIAESLSVSYEQSIDLLNELVKDNLLMQIYVVRCDECHYSENYYDFNEIPINGYINCPNGHKTFVNLDDIQIWYKLNKEMIIELKQSKKKDQVLV